MAHNNDDKMTRRDVMKSSLSIPPLLFGLDWFGSPLTVTDDPDPIVDDWELIEEISFSDGLTADFSSGVLEIMATNQRAAKQPSSSSSRLHQLGLIGHRTNYSAGWTNVEIGRITLQGDESLEVWRVSAEMAGGGQTADFTLDLYDLSTGEVLTSVTGGSINDADDTPLATSSTGATVIARVTTPSGQDVDVMPSGDLLIV